MASADLHRASSTATKLYDTKKRDEPDLLEPFRDRNYFNQQVKKNHNYRHAHYMMQAVRIAVIAERVIRASGDSRREIVGGRPAMFRKCRVELEHGVKMPFPEILKKRLREALTAIPAQ